MSRPASLISANPQGQVNTRPAAAQVKKPATTIDRLEQQANEALGMADIEPGGTSATGGEIIPTGMDAHDHELMVQAQGSSLAAQLERQNAAHQGQLNALNSQYSTTIGALEQKITDLTGSVQTLATNTPAQRVMTPEERNRLTEEELVEIESSQGAITKLARTEAERIRDDIITEMNQRHAADRKAMQTTIDELKSQQTLQNNMTRAGYDTTVNNTARSLQLDAARLPNDAAFNAYLNQPENPYVPNGRKLAHTVQEAEDAGRADITSNVLSGFIDYLSVNNMQSSAVLNSLTNSSIQPGGGGGATGQSTEVSTEDQQVEKMMNARAEIASELTEANNLMTARQIGIEDYRETVGRLQEMDNRLLTALASKTL